MYGYDRFEKKNIVTLRVKGALVHWCIVLKLVINLREDDDGTQMVHLLYL